MTDKDLSELIKLKKQIDELNDFIRSQAEHAVKRPIKYVKYIAYNRWLTGNREKAYEINVPNDVHDAFMIEVIKHRDNLLEAFKCK